MLSVKTCSRIRRLSLNFASSRWIITTTLPSIHSQTAFSHSSSNNSLAKNRRTKCGSRLGFNHSHNNNSSSSSALPSLFLEAMVAEINSKCQCSKVIKIAAMPSDRSKEMTTLTTSLNNNKYLRTKWWVTWLISRWCSVTRHHYLLDSLSMALSLSASIRKSLTKTRVSSLCRPSMTYRWLR